MGSLAARPPDLTPMGKSDEMLDAVRVYYSDKIVAHGATARGVDWNSAESQRVRFRELLRVCGDGPIGSLNDFGCGYGALHDFLGENGRLTDYRGFDVSAAMLEEARRLHPQIPSERFVQAIEELPAAGFTVASGIFNVKLNAPVEDWKGYVATTIDQLAARSRKGFAFNMLTSYSDRDRMRDDLYYGDPCFYFDLCKRKHSRWVSLLHDYGLYEFTIIVKLEV